jgi:ferritin-like metal-binding protein YciE
MEDTRDRTIRYLQDLHAAEKGAEDALEGLTRDDDTPGEVRTMASEALQNTRSRVNAIDRRITELGGDTSGMKDWGNTAMAKISDLFGSAHDDEDKLTQDLIKSHAGAHLIHGSYRALCSFCEATGDAQTLQLAQTNAMQVKTYAETALTAVDAAARRAVRRAA